MTETKQPPTPKIPDQEATFVNVLMPRTLAEKLQAMVEVDDTDRSKFVRRLIASEWNRRQNATSKFKVKLGQVQSNTR